MKHKSLTMIISSVFIIALLSLNGCSHHPTHLVFEEYRQAHDVDNQNTIVTTLPYDESFPDAMGYSSTEILGIEPSPSFPPEILTLVLSGKGSVSGMIWDDDGDGIHKPGEPGVAGIRVFVDLNGDETYSLGEPASFTDDSGGYEIREIRVGLRTITFSVHVDKTTLPQGYVILSNHPLSIKVVKNKKYQDADFGVQNRSAGIYGNVCNDSNANGCAPSSDTPISVVRVYVDLDNDDDYTPGHDPYATTAINGNYAIQQVPAGTYKVYVDNGTLPVVYHRTPVSGTNPTVVNLVRNTSSPVSFGYLKKVTINGFLRDNNGNTWGNVTLFIDLNGNGVYDEGEPVTKTDIYGRYIFNNLYPGTFQIMVRGGQLPGGYDTNLLSITLGEGINHTVDLLLQTKSKFSVVNALQSPTRLSWGSDNHIYVSDYKIGSVFVFDSSLALLNELKGLNKPLGVNTDASGNIYVGVQGSKSVIKYDTSGNYLKSYGKGYIITPNDITFDAAGNMYVLDSESDAIYVFNPAGTLIRTIGNSNQLSYAVSIAIHYQPSGAGELYVADLYQKQILVFSLQGGFDLVRTIGGPATGTSMMNIDAPLDWEGFFVGLKAIDFDKAGTLHALDSSLNVVSRFNPFTGEYLGYYNAYETANATKLNLQSDISISSQGEVVQANAANRRVELINIIP